MRRATPNPQKTTSPPITVAVTCRSLIPAGSTARMSSLSATKSASRDHLAGYPDLMDVHSVPVVTVHHAHEWASVGEG